MTLEDEERMLIALEGEYKQAIMSLSAYSGSSHFYETMLWMKRVNEYQRLIDNLEKSIAIQKGQTFTTDFGQLVCSEKEQTYWNSVYKRVDPLTNPDVRKMKLN